MPEEKLSLEEIGALLVEIFSALRQLPQEIVRTGRKEGMIQQIHKRLARCEEECIRLSRSPTAYAAYLRARAEAKAQRECETCGGKMETVAPGTELCQGCGMLTYQPERFRKGE